MSPGWVILGHLDSHNNYLQGPHYRDQNQENTKPLTPNINSHIELLTERKLYIHQYLSAGTSKISLAPTITELTGGAKTGLILKKGLIVRVLETQRLVTKTNQFVVIAKIGLPKNR